MFVLSKDARFPVTAVETNLKMQILEQSDGALEPQPIMLSQLFKHPKFC